MNPPYHICAFLDPHTMINSPPAFIRTEAALRGSYAVKEA